MDDRMERITRQAVGRWLSHRDGEDLHQEARIAYWQSESDPDALLVVKVRRRAIDAWRKMTRRREVLVDRLPDSPTNSAEFYDAAHLGLPDGWRRMVENAANDRGAIDEVHAAAIRTYLEVTGKNKKLGL